MLEFMVVINSFEFVVNQNTLLDIRRELFTMAA